jgi:hypothetical protein
MQQKLLNNLFILLTVYMQHGGRGVTLTTHPI